MKGLLPGGGWGGGRRRDRAHVTPGLKSRLWIRAAKSASPQFLVRVGSEVLGGLVPASVRHKSRADPASCLLDSVFGRFQAASPLPLTTAGWLGRAAPPTPPDQHLPVPSLSWVTCGATVGAVPERPLWEGTMGAVHSVGRHPPSLWCCGH